MSSPKSQRSAPGAWVSVWMCVFVCVCSNAMASGVMKLGAVVAAASHAVRGDELVHHRRVGERGGVAELVCSHLLARGGDLAEDAPHDLARARLWQRWRPVDHIGRRECADLGAALHDEGFAQLVRLVDALVERDVDVDALALDRVRVADHRRLRDVRVEHYGRLDLGRADPVARHVDHVVHAAGDPVVAVLIAAAAVAGEVEAGDGEVGLLVPLVVAEDVADGRRPRRLDSEEALACAFLLLALLVDDGGLHAEEGTHRAAGLHRGALDRQRHDHDAARLRLPPRVNDRAARATDLFVVPAPRLRVDGLAHRAEQLERRAARPLQRPCPLPHQRADGGRRRVELRDLVLVDHAPEAARVRVGRHALEHELRRSIEERAVRHVRVAGDPAAVGGAKVDVVWLQVEDVLCGRGGVHHVPARRVQHALRLAGRAGRVQDEERVLCAHPLHAALGLGGRRRVSPPDVAPMLE
mmetsp:Transcript_1801/g.5446  ORF Transcript_1801/g.5446 Transcript_1801/m.5446 type:complete len:469 (+) Transcript_1801:145-1551(+)